MINVYSYSFVSECPNDGEMIVYSLELKCNEMIHVEHIKKEASLHKKAYGEDIAKAFHERFPHAFGRLSAVHQGVTATHLFG